MPAWRLVHADSLAAYELAPDHPFKPLRARLTVSLLQHAGLLEPDELVQPDPLPPGALELVHDREYIAAVRQGGGPDRHRFGLGTADNPVHPGMHEAARLTCAATATAVELVASGQAAGALVPSGGLHHAMNRRAAGFCVYNDLAVAVRLAVRKHGMRVAVIDLDAHHGDGTQEAFYTDGSVLTISLHESGRYLFPGTGHTYELGRDAGRGLSINAPLEPFTDDDGYLEVLEAVVAPALRRFRPDLLLVQAGADTHLHDPLADLALSLRGMRKSYGLCMDWARTHAGGRIVFTGGGGYDAWRTVPRAWAHVWSVLTGRPLPDRLPAAWRAEFPTLDLPAESLDGPFPEQPRRRLIQGQNRAMLERLGRALGSLGDDPDTV